MCADMPVALRVKSPLSMSNLNEIELPRQFFVKFIGNKCHNNPPSGSRVVLCVRADGRTEGT